MEKTIHSVIEANDNGLTYADLRKEFADKTKFEFDIMLLRALRSGKVRPRGGRLYTEQAYLGAPAH